MSFRSDTHTRKVANHIQLFRNTDCCESHTSARGPIPSSSLASKRFGENSWRCISDTHTILLNIIVNHIQLFRNTVANHMKEKIIPNFLLKRSSDPSKFPAQNQRLLVRCGDVPTDTRDASALVRSRPLQGAISRYRYVLSALPSSLSSVSGLESRRLLASDHWTRQDSMIWFRIV
jgi:hypothetical protein